MRPRLACLIVSLCLFPLAAQAVLNTHDARPAATLLLPDFEVDPIPNFPESPSGTQLVGVPKTVFTVGNAGPAPIIARVTLWTDFGIPTVSFHLFLTGFDIETIDLKQAFDGIFPGLGPGNCASGIATRLPASDIIGLRNAHSGQPSSLLGNLCGSRDFGDGALRGFVTVDAVTECNDTLLPNEPAYSSILAASNVLRGHCDFIDPTQNSSVSGSLVHVETGPFAAGDPRSTDASTGSTAPTTARRWATCGGCASPTAARSTEAPRCGYGASRARCRRRWGVRWWAFRRRNRAPPIGSPSSMSPKTSCPSSLAHRLCP
jgi:hypothetical protein